VFENVTNLGFILGWLSVFLHLTAFAIYNWKIVRGLSRPNTATWGIWAIVASLNCASYFFMSQDWVKSLSAIAASVACIFTFVFALFRGRLSKLDRSDGIVLVISVSAIIVWWVFRSATFANLLLQGALVAGFIPTLRDVVRKPEQESALPWLMWSLVYVLLLLIVLLRWSNHWPDLVYPINSLFWHLLVGVLACRR